MPELPPPPVLLELLRSQPGRIGEWVDGLTEKQLHTAPAEGEWSLTDILAHLRSCADVWGGRLERILSEDHPTLRAVNPTTYIQQTNYPDQKYWPSFAAFLKQRHDLLSRLSGLRPEQWLRTATVLGAGRPLEHSVHTYVERIAVHERQHLRQVRRTAEAVR